MHGEADARESGRLEWTLNDDDDEYSKNYQLQIEYSTLRITNYKENSIQ